MKIDWGVYVTFLDEDIDCWERVVVWDVTTTGDDDSIPLLFVLLALLLSLLLLLLDEVRFSALLLQLFAELLLFEEEDEEFLLLSFDMGFFISVLLPCYLRGRSNRFDSILFLSYSILLYFTKTHKHNTITTNE